jgi:hypothetical protein
LFYPGDGLEVFFFGGLVRIFRITHGVQLDQKGYRVYRLAGKALAYSSLPGRKNSF